MFPWSNEHFDRLSEQRTIVGRSQSVLVRVEESIPTSNEALANDILKLGFGVALLVEHVGDVSKTVGHQSAELGSDERAKGRVERGA